MKEEQELEDNAEVKRTPLHRKVCCPDCKTGSCRCMSDLPGHGDICGNPDCLCHHPIKVNVVDSSKVTAKFG